jgi:hypothetical protein
MLNTLTKTCEEIPKCRRCQHHFRCPFWRVVLMVKIAIGCVQKMSGVFMLENHESSSLRRGKTKGVTFQSWGNTETRAIIEPFFPTHSRRSPRRLLGRLAAQSFSDSHRTTNSTTLRGQHLNSTQTPQSCCPSISHRNRLLLSTPIMEDPAAVAGANATTLTVASNSTSTPSATFSSLPNELLLMVTKRLYAPSLDSLAVTS